MLESMQAQWTTKSPSSPYGDPSCYMADEDEDPRSRVLHNPLNYVPEEVRGMKNPSGEVTYPGCPRNRTHKTLDEQEEGLDRCAKFYCVRTAHGDALLLKVLMNIKSSVIGNAWKQ